MVKDTNRKGIRNKYKVDIGIREIYTRYKEDCEKAQATGTYWSKLEKRDPGYKVFKKVLKRYFDIIQYKLLYEAVIYKIPHSLGTLRIQKRSTNVTECLMRNQLKMNYPEYNKTGKVVFYLNEHRNYHNYTIKWHKPHRTYILNYQFLPHRKRLTRKLAHILQFEHNVDYFE